MEYEIQISTASVALAITLIPVFAGVIFLMAIYVVNALIIVIGGVKDMFNGIL